MRSIWPVVNPVQQDLFRKSANNLAVKYGSIYHLRCCVVHVVVNRVLPRLIWARITTCRAAGTGTRLGGGIVDIVTRPRAVVAFKSMGKTEPVTSFVNGNEANSTLCQSAAITYKRIRTLRRAGRVVAVTGSRRKNIDDVNVDGLVAALAESSLHGHFLTVTLVGPVAIDSLGVSSVIEVNPIWAKAVAQSVKLELEISVGAEAILAGGDGMQIDVNANGPLNDEARISSCSLLHGHSLGGLEELFGGFARATCEVAVVDSGAHGHSSKEESRLKKHLDQANVEAVKYIHTKKKKKESRRDRTKGKGMMIPGDGGREIEGKVEPEAYFYAFLTLFRPLRSAFPLHAESGM